MKWPIYNQSLVRSGELLLTFDVIDNWDLESKQMDKDKMKITRVFENMMIKMQSVEMR